MSDVIRVSADAARADGAGSDGAVGDLNSFFDWLREEPEIQRHALITREPTTGGEGAMGGTLEVVKLVIDTGFQVLNLGLAYAAWRATRPKPAALTIERDGVRVVLDDDDPEAVVRIVRVLEG